MPPRVARRVLPFRFLASTRISVGQQSTTGHTSPTGGDYAEKFRLPALPHLNDSAPTVRAGPAAGTRPGCSYSAILGCRQ